MSRDSVARGMAGSAYGRTERFRNVHTFARLGDSRSSVQWLDFSTRRNIANADPVNWANVHAGQRMIFSPANNFAVSGHRTDQQLAYLQSAINTGAGNLLIWLGVNDFSQNVTDAVAFENVKAMCKAALAAGMRPWVFTEPGATAMNATQTGYRNDFNQRLREYAESGVGVVLYDLADAMCDNDATSAIAFKTNYSADGTHPNANGSYYMGLAFSGLVKDVIPPLPIQAIDGREANGVGTSSKIYNPMFAVGTAGAVGTGNSGTLPTSFTGLRTGSANGAFSIAPEPDGYGNQVTINATFAAADETVRVSQGLDFASLTAGDIIEGGCEIDIASGPTNLRSAVCMIDVTVDGVQTQYFGMMGATAYGSIPGGGTKMVLRTGKLTIPAGNLTAASWQVRLYAHGAGSASVTVRKPWARKRFAF